MVSVIAGICLTLLFVETWCDRKRNDWDTYCRSCAIWNGFTSPIAQVWLVGGQLILALSLMEGFTPWPIRMSLWVFPGRRALNQLMDQSSGDSICMVDVDHFKKFNDKYGHDAGDEVLRMVAAQIGQVGSGGRAFRYGGEEFTVVFPGKTCSRAADELEHLRSTIAARPFVFRAKGRPKERPESPKPVQAATERAHYGKFGFSGFLWWCPRSKRCPKNRGSAAVSRQRCGSEWAYVVCQTLSIICSSWMWVSSEISWESGVSVAVA